MTKSCKQPQIGLTWTSKNECSAIATMLRDASRAQTVKQLATGTGWEPEDLRRILTHMSTVGDICALYIPGKKQTRWRLDRPFSELKTIYRPPTEECDDQ